MFNGVTSEKERLLTIEEEGGYTRERLCIWRGLGKWKRTRKLLGIKAAKKLGLKNGVVKPYSFSII